MRRGIGAVKELREWMADAVFPLERPDVILHLQKTRAPAQVLVTADQLPSKTFEDLNDVMKNVEH